MNPSKGKKMTKSKNMTTNTVKKASMGGVPKGKMTLTQRTKDGAGKLTKGAKVATKVAKVTKGAETARVEQCATTAARQVT